MTKEELIEFLKENLSVTVSVDNFQEYYSSGITVTVNLRLDGEVISSSYESISIPTRD